MLNGRTAEDFNEFKSLFYRNKSEIYGTHDWIADRAIHILNDHFPNDHLINSIFSNFDNMIWHTYFGSPHRNGAFQKSFIPDWKWYSTIKIKELNRKKDLFICRKWWRGIEVHLNLAIFYTATAINYLRNL